MLMTIEREPATMMPEELAEVRSLHDAGQTLRAFERAGGLGRLRSLRETEARILAGSIVSHLGSQRLGTAMQIRAWRDDPADPAACLYRTFALLTRRGPLPTWEFLGAVGPLPDAPPRERGHWLSMHAIVLGHFRDFDAAELWLARAEDAAPGDPWLLVQRAGLFEMEDRCDEALDASRRSLEIRPWYRPAVQQRAHLLQLLDRDDEAVALLTEAADRIESAAVVAQLGVLQAEMGRHADARRTWDRMASLPLIDEKTRTWLAGRRSDAAYECGELAEAAALARACGGPFFTTIATRLEAADAGVDSRRVRLAVGFVRQHHQTCAPATLASISRFWGQPADHLELAAEICYDGTPDHLQRSWAERNGYLAREFSVTWDSARALLDRGVPFTLATVETQNAHLQAVIGYDAQRGTLLIRDPTLPYEGEALGEEMLARYRSTGPRGMAMVPADRAELLEGLDLPASSLYDHVHRMQMALRAHDRDSAGAASAALEAEAPGHRLARHARSLLAHYDADPAALLAGIVAQLELFPDDVNLRLGQLGTLRMLGRRDERLALYREHCGRSDADPLLRRQYAQELLADAREHSEAVRLARRALRARPSDPAALAILAEVASDGGRRAEAVELYRLAACLDDKDEGLARSYFLAARLLHHEDAAVAFLRGRFRRLGARSVWPARTLYWSLCQLERRREAFEVLDESLRLRPEDGELRLFAAEAHAAHGEFDRADERLESARGLCRRGDWLRTSALLAAVRGDLGGSLELWLQVLDGEPSAVDANRAVARRLAETRGRDEALAHLARACERFPHNYALNQAWIEWLRADGPAAVEPAARRILEIHPADAWSRRELALALARQGRLDEAAAEIRLASELEPGSPAEAAVRAQVVELAGRLDEARGAYREAIERSVDMDFAIDHLIACCASRAERVEALAFVEAELHRQVIFGDGLLAFARHARGTVEPDALLTSLRNAREVRPDLWHAWSALVHELVGRNHHDEALDLTREATERFPLLAEVWLDLAAVCRARKDGDGELAALDRALQISPGHSIAARQRAMALERDGDYAGSRALLERAIAYAPLDPFNHTCLADALWHLDQGEEAVDRLLHAMRLEPDQDWAWDTLRRWSIELDRRDVPLSLARELTEQRAGEASNWVRLARLLSGEEYLEERLAALDRAIALDPADIEPYDLRAHLLAEAGRYDEAEASCRPSAWGDSPPTPLLGRSAWILAQQGDLAAAIGRMRSVLEANPDYYWGWLNQAEWTCDAGTPAEYLAAAEGLNRLCPDDPVAAGYLGDARRRNNDRDAARAAFRGAFDRTPTHGYTAYNLFDMELEDNRLNEAAEVLDGLKTHHDGALTLAREVQLAQARGDRATAVAALERLCVTALPDNDWPQNAADKCFTQAGWNREALEVYERALDLPDLVPRVAALWVERRMTQTRRGCAQRLGSLLEQGERGFVALEAHLHRLAREKSKLRLWAVMRRHGAAIRANTRCWGTLGFALTSVAWNGRAARWLADWRDRHDAHPWMLINLALTLRGLKKIDEANQVSRRALELPADYTVPYHRIWLALDDLIDGDGRQAPSLLDGHDPERYDATNRYLLTLARLLLERAQAAPAGRRSVLRLTGRRLFRFCFRHRIPMEDYDAVANTYRRVVRRMSADLDPVTGFFWRIACGLATPIRVG